ncbi:MAG: DNA repair protein RecN [Flavobacteriales bacterium]|nr:DNA repair protein RecN [Flavobacteriales bacterium]
MLTRLHIRNYAIISELDVKLNNGLTIITGETGAGKSILIGALSMVLGKRADSSVLYKEDEKCVVEAFFNIENYNLKPFFEENDLDFENPTILRREINANGKSRAFINDTPVTLVQLKDLASYLIDIHSQHEVLTLKSADFRTRFLDSCADGGEQIYAYQKVYQEWNALRKEVERLKDALQKSAQDEDYLKFQLSELEELNLKEGELVESQEKLSMLENAEEISGTLSQVSDALLNSDNAMVDNLRKIETELQRLSKKYPTAADWSERIKQNLIDLEDVAEEMAQKAGSVEHDPIELERLAERVDEIIRLMSKHRKQTEAELIQYQSELDAKLSSISHSDEQLTLLNGKLEKIESLLQTEADKLSNLRLTEAKRIAPILMAELQQLGMPDAQMEIQLEKTDRNASGQDKIEILFTANKGQKPQDISKIASGGELSRLMLSTKAEMASKTQLPAIIFDEVDTGVSGDVADKMGGKIKELSSRMQVLCITHLPQIASKANQHLYVYKEEQEGRTSTGVRELDKAGRIVEIAKMLSNANPTEAALTHAKNMVNLNN